MRACYSLVFLKLPTLYLEFSLGANEIETTFGNQNLLKMLFLSYYSRHKPECSVTQLRPLIPHTGVPAVSV